MKRIGVSGMILAAALALGACATQTPQDRRLTGQIIGGATGAAVGSVFGGGTGKIVTTGAGAVLGAIAGGRLAEGQ